MNQRLRKDYHAVLKRARIAAKLTQAQLAARAGLAQQTIDKVERDGGNLTVETLCAYCNGVDVDVKDLLVGGA